MIDFDDPRLMLCDDSPFGRICQTCHGTTFVFGEEGFLMDCHGPCHGTGRTDLPLPEVTQ